MYGKFVNGELVFASDDMSEEELRADKYLPVVETIPVYDSTLEDVEICDYICEGDMSSIEIVYQVVKPINVYESILEEEVNR